MPTTWGISSLPHCIAGPFALVGNAVLRRWKRKFIVLPFVRWRNDLCSGSNEHLQRKAFVCVWERDDNHQTAVMRPCFFFSLTLEGWNRLGQSGIEEKNTIQPPIVLPSVFFPASARENLPGSWTPARQACWGGLRPALRFRINCTLTSTASYWLHIIVQLWSKPGVVTRTEFYECQWIDLFVNSEKKCSLRWLLNTYIE